MPTRKSSRSRRVLQGPRIVGRGKPMDASTSNSRCGNSSRASSAGTRRASRELFLCSTATVRRRDECDDDFLARVTHLRLHNKGICGLDNANVFDACPSLKVLYLYDNCVESLRGLEKLRQLEQLHVENNFLTTITHTLSCQRLKKLHLNGNSILTLGGLESAKCLEELHVAKQRLPKGERFTIEQASVYGMKDTLVLLDASGNGMGGTEMEVLLDLHRLETLNLADNDIQDMAQVVDLVSSLGALRDIDLRGNAVSRMAKYFERAVTRCGDSLTSLDGKPVHAQHRSMLQRLDRHKRAEARKGAGKKLYNSAAHAPIAEPRVHGATVRPVGEAFLSSGQEQRHAVHFANSTDGFKTNGDQDRDLPAVSWPR